MTPITITVTSERGPYLVVIGAGASAGLRTQLAARQLAGPRLIVSSARVWRHQGQRVAAGLRATRADVTLIGDGERAKTLASVDRLYRACLSRTLDRSGIVIAIGGGVVGDVAGFAAASFLRGIRLVQVPTTLLAQVDSAIGGKVGVNLPAGKNLVGAFHSPSLVLCDPVLLDTLSRREFRAGLYEVVKYGVIASRGLFDLVQDRLEAIFDRERATLTRIVAECCQIKATVVMADERESGPRRILNFGHTVGHALEAITHYRRFRHGEAIGYGMLAAAHLSRLRALLADSDAEALRALLARMAAVGPVPPVNDLRISDALDAITRDKKVVNGRLHFVLAHGIGGTEIVSDVTPRELRSAMRAIGMRA
jgi:3-dehydroquinate synthase